MPGEDARDSLHLPPDDDGRRACPVTDLLHEMLRDGGALHRVTVRPGAHDRDHWRPGPHGALPVVGDRTRP